MSDDNRAHILALLKNYRKDSNTIKVYRFELSTFAHVTGDEVIEAMNFASGDGVGGVNGHISDKTAYIAMHYSQKVDSLNSESSKSLAERLWRMEQERARLHFYVSLLEPKQEMVIRLHYFDGKTRVAVCKELGIAPRTYDSYHKEAVDELCRMFGMLKNGGGAKQQ